MSNFKHILILFFVSLIFTNDAIHRDNSLLFSLKKSMKPLEFSQDWNRTDNQDINNFLERYGIFKIEPWLISATEKDFDGEIYLNRIYRITFSEKTKNTILSAMEELKSIPGVQYVERENRHKIYYTPNDSQYGQQWFLPAINSNDAWIFGILMVEKYLETNRLF